MTLKNLLRFSTRIVPHSLVLVYFFSAGISSLSAQPIIIGHNQSHLEDLKSIPLEWIDSAKAKIRLAYFHTSHGNQINRGLTPLDAFMGGEGIYLRGEGGGPGVLFFNDNYGPDLSNREGTFDDHTRAYLDDPAHQDINLIMWSWCQILGHDGDKNPGYCSNMDSLIEEYGPDGSKIKSGERAVPVRFVYMTGHLNGQGEGGRTHEINNYIRDHCITNSRILYDFADIESYDPDDNYFLDDSTNDECYYMVNGQRSGNWAVEWAEGKVMMDGEDDTQHNEPNGGQYYQCDPPHTHAVNGNMKAFAFWYLMARLAGWEGTDTIAVSAAPAFETPDDSDRISVFPNPSADYIRIQGDLQFPAVLGIYNVTGKLVREERITTGDRPIDVSGLKEGLYILRINGEGRARAASFMKR